MPQQTDSKVIGGRENQGSLTKGASPVATLVSRVPQCASYGKFHSRECRSGSEGALIVDK